MNRRKAEAAAGIVLVLGLGTFLYPSISNLYNRYHASEAIAFYNESSDEMDRLENEQMMREAQQWNRDLLEGKEGSADAYNTLLDVSGTGIMAYLEIPSIDVRLPVYHGTDEGVLQIAAGHMMSTSLPVGGKGTHSVIPGHCGLKRARLFTDLDRLKEGDRFTICVLGERHTYEIDRISTVLPEDTTRIDIDPDEDYCTLLTCTPYGLNTHRLLVRGRRVKEDISEPVMHVRKVPVCAYVMLGISSAVLIRMVHELMKRVDAEGC